MSTLKVGSTGRLGSRYGVSIRKRLLKVEDKQKDLASCSFCGFSKIKREAPGLFVCHKCGVRFAGGAYVPETLIGKTIKKMVSQKTFVVDKQIVSNAKESSFADIEKAVEQSMADDSVKELKERSKRNE